MRILLDITHPAHLHFFRWVLPELRGRGHELRLVGRDKDILRALAGELGVEMTFFGGAPAGVGPMARTLVRRKQWLAGVFDAFRPDVVAALGGTFIGFLSWAKRVPSVVFYDTENAVLSNRITYPFASRVCTPRAYLHDVPRQVRYDGYHELAYLAPSVFTPDPAVRAEMGLAGDEPYAVVRFVGWEASHDLGHAGLGLAGQRRLVDSLKQAGRVFVSSEGPLPADLEPLRFPLPRVRMHDALAFAAVVVGESSTMASEAAVLGVPSVFVHPLIERGYTREQAERWGIVNWYTPDRVGEASAHARSLVERPETEKWRDIGRRIVADSVDVRTFACDQIEAAARAGRRDRV